MKDDNRSQVVSVRLNSEQLDFLNTMKLEMEADLEADVSMATVIRRILSRYINKHQKGGGDRARRFFELEERVAALEARLDAKE
ncbi:hypothetical protein [Gallaecimonas mangrovi]|uniref:hypothetical protein n=1 Tax=Gallaecimonas mangrovi TaxID=2291597 RepID=UPI000E205195|nr:hypothetical protein [Gallaecimonas mangrovi]